VIVLGSVGQTAGYTRITHPLGNRHDTHRGGPQDVRDALQVEISLHVEQVSIPGRRVRSDVQHVIDIRTTLPADRVERLPLGDQVAPFHRWVVGIDGAYLESRFRRQDVGLQVIHPIPLVELGLRPACRHGVGDLPF
jgi:hypothetical protein